MLDRSGARSSPPWVRRAMPLFGAAIALAIAAWLTYAGVDYARNGCNCNEAWYPGWIWLPMLGLAGVSYLLALGIIARAVTRRRAGG